MRVHWCLLDPVCRSVGAGHRFYVFIGKRHWWIAWRDCGYHKK